MFTTVAGLVENLTDNEATKRTVRLGETIPRKAKRASRPHRDAQTPTTKLANLSTQPVYRLPSQLT